MSSDGALACFTSSFAEKTGAVLNDFSIQLSVDAKAQIAILSRHNLNHDKILRGGGDLYIFIDMTFLKAHQQHSLMDHRTREKKF